MRKLFLFLPLLLAACGEPFPENGANGASNLRVVTLAPHLAEMMYAVGAEEQLVATVSYSDYPPDAANLPLVGDAFRVDAEQLALIAPDLILVWPQGNPKALIDALRGSGYRVEGRDISDIESVAAQIEQIGELTGHESQATAIANELRKRIEVLRIDYQDRRTVSVFYQISAQPLFTIGGRQIISDVIELCGGHNIFSELEDLAPVVGVESVLERDPEVMISGRFNGENPLSIWDTFDELTAVRKQQRFLVDAALLARAGPRLADGAAQVCELIDRAR